MRTLLIISVVLVLISCSKQSTVGIYQRKFETLALKADSTYEYRFKIENTLAASKGRWEAVKQGRIRLNSLYNMENLSLKVSELYSQDCKNLKIIIESVIDSIQVNKDNIEYGFVINGIERMKQKEAFLTVPFFKIESIKLNIYYTFNALPVTQVTRNVISTDTYKVKSSQANLFKLNFPFNIELFNSETVNNNILRQKGNKIYWREKGNTPFRKP